jgi:ribokinase
LLTASQRASSLLLRPGQNRIILHGGANTAPWQLSEDAKRCIQTAGAVLLQREIPEAVNLEVAEVGGIQS